LSRDEGKCFQAMWGKLAAEIVLANWDSALEDLLVLRETIERRGSSELEALQHRTWLLNWSLFVFFRVDDGRAAGLVDLFFQERMLNTVQMAAPHLLHYLTAACLLNKKKKNVLRDVVRVIVQEESAFSSPLTEFLRSLYSEFDFDVAHTKLQTCKKVLRADYFLAPIADELVDACRQLVFETYCRIHKTIDLRVLLERLEIPAAECERALSEYIRGSRVDAKIDLENNLLVLEKHYSTAHQQVLDKTRQISFRTTQLMNQLDKRFLHSM